MEQHKNYLNNSKKPIQKYVPGNIRKKFTAQVPTQESLYKPVRMNSVNKQTRGLNGGFSYGINGINYSKMKEIDHLNNEVEEVKALRAFPNKYAASRGKNEFSYKQESEKKEEIDDEQFFKSKLYSLTEKVRELEEKLESRDLEIKRIKLQNKKLLSEKNLIEDKLK